MGQRNDLTNSSAARIRCPARPRSCLFFSVAASFPTCRWVLPVGQASPPVPRRHGLGVQPEALPDRRGRLSYGKRLLAATPLQAITTTEGENHDRRKEASWQEKSEAPG